MAKKKPKMGRPPKSPSERRSEIFKFRVTRPEREEIEAAGGSDWARDVLLKAARRKR